MPAERDPAPVAAVVLAAGSSTRMGVNKLLLRIDGETLVARAVRCAAAAGLDPVVVVLGHEAEKVHEALSAIPCRTVVNDRHLSGQATSFRAGIGAAGDAPAAVVLLADMPYVTPDMLRALVMVHRETGAPIVFSDYGGVSAPPTLYDRSLFEEIAQSDGCGRQMVERHRERARTVLWPADRLADLDEPKDLERLRVAGTAELSCVPIS